MDCKCEGEGIRAYGSCGWLVRHTYCGAIKVIEYNKMTGYLTYWHQGFHICTLKPNIHMRRTALDNMPLPLTAASTPSSIGRIVCYIILRKIIVMLALMLQMLFLNRML